MKKSFIYSLAILLLSSLFVILSPFSTAVAAIHVNPIPNLPPDFIKGADVSMLPEIEKQGGKFYENGTSKDCLEILKNHGINWIRLRIWNNPYQNGVPVGGGNTDESKALLMAARAKKLGLKVLLDFHYSDFWADPGKQNKPAAWANDNPQKLTHDIYDFTAKVVKDFNNKDLTPDMIQIGNEVNNGILWPDGKTTSPNGYKNLANMLNAGLKAVSDNDPQHKIKKMIHVAGCDDAFYQTFFDELIIKNKVNDFDIIGMSFYPFWHGTLPKLENTMNDISSRYNKKIVVVETAFGFTNANGDSQKNVYGSAEEKLSGYKSTVQGQASGIRDVMAAVSKVKNSCGLGIFYWEPDWIPTPNAGWKTNEGNEWDNLAMFDFKGNALDSLNVFKLVSDPDNKYIKPLPKRAEPVTISAPVNKIINLPTKVDIIFSNDSVTSLPVIWNTPLPSYSQTGTYTLHGKVADTEIPATIILNIIDKTNLITNGDFETGNLAGWTITGDKTAVNNVGTSGNALGKSAMHYWAPKDFSCKIQQKISHLKPGIYTLSCWTQGSGNENSYELFLTTGTNKHYVTIKNTGWNKWHQSIIKNVKIENGTADIGFILKGKAGSWGSIDDIEFYLQK
ncbi:glycosyl hydrolase 53 family protein [Pectinatus sottacetonis]|uniref:glycosyl hydrolase 53 family protein n=1 Tax=Pectinatus sottacetonis TaxID=1002795 RepID=UPI0018C612F1|nr:glycosyl hydrolase 53 family protein [Pectinatus sottacetonis]